MKTTNRNPNTALPSREELIKIADDFRAALRAYRKISEICLQHYPGKTKKAALKALAAIDEWRCNLDREFHATMSEEEFKAHGKPAGYPFYSRETEEKSNDD